MMKANRLLFLVFWLANLLPAHSQNRNQTPANSVPRALPPGVELRIEAMPRTGTIGDPIQLYVDIFMPEGYQVDVPRIDTSIGDFAILDFKPGSTQPEALSNQKPLESKTKRLHRHIQILTAIYKTGKFTFPSLDFKLKTADLKEIAIASDPVSIEIRSILVDKTPNIKDLKKQAEIPEPIRWLLWISLALAAIILLFLFLFLRKRKRAAPANEAPAQVQDLLVVAEADLRKLIAGGLPTFGMEKQFYVRLSEISKRILESGYKISAIEQTTDEIMDALHNKPPISLDDAELISSFLINCDLVKFAKYIPSKSEQETAVTKVVEILDCAKKNSCQLPVVSEN
jgi:hypothetical protein